MDIPQRTIFRGDVERCKALVGDARRVMWILENMMKQRGLQQHVIRMEPYPGAMITCSKVFGARTMTIRTPTGGHEVQEEEKICICNCNLSEGWILEVQETDIDGAQLYTVMACNNAGRAYKRHENVLASDFTLYEPAQKVMLTPYNTMSYLCCSLPDGPSGCRPLKSELETDDEDWRTTYRILPWCALNVPKLVDKSRFKSG